jgi:poly(3-hydroxybutyrate) depolymerase
MKKLPYILFYIFFALLGLPGKGELYAQRMEFSKETFSSTGMTLPYRKATIPGNETNASLVVYLHGGSSKGDDNETPDAGTGH